jgi:hypothetical protein
MWPFASPPLCPIGEGLRRRPPNGSRWIGGPRGPRRQPPGWTNRASSRRRKAESRSKWPRRFPAHTRRSPRTGIPCNRKPAKRSIGKPPRTPRPPGQKQSPPTEDPYKRKTFHRKFHCSTHPKKSGDGLLPSARTGTLCSALCRRWPRVIRGIPTRRAAPATPRSEGFWRWPRGRLGRGF